MTLGAIGISFIVIGCLIVLGLVILVGWLICYFLRRSRVRNQVTTENLSYNEPVNFTLPLELYYQADQFEHRGALNIRKSMKYEDLQLDNPQLDYDPNPEDAHFQLNKDGGVVFDIGSKIEVVK